MASWFSWSMVWAAAVALWSVWWVLGQLGVRFSPWEVLWSLVSWIPNRLRKTEPADSEPPFGIEKVSDAVYLLHEPEGTPEIDIVFIHGLQLSGFKDAYWETWTTWDEASKETICWPKTWLAEAFPRARILSVSYDSSALSTASTARLDTYAAGESLATEMVKFGGIGRQCPVLFVCHSLGGLVVKEVVLQAHRKHGDEEEFKTFLNNIAGFHFYATPHDGSKLADLADALPIPFVNKGPMMKHLVALDKTNGRLKREFEGMTKKDFLDKWKFSVVAEQNATKMGKFYALVVSEASASYGDHPFLPVSLDHFQVCKPSSKNATVFKSLTSFIVQCGSTITTGAQVREESARML